jgi:hypothetical protein
MKSTQFVLQIDNTRIFFYLAVMTRWLKCGIAERSKITSLLVFLLATLKESQMFAVKETESTLLAMAKTSFSKFGISEKWSHPKNFDE